MGKSKKKAGNGPPSEVRDLVSERLSLLEKSLPAESTADLLSELLSGLSGHEAAMFEAMGSLNNGQVLNFLYRIMPLLNDRSQLKAVRGAIYRLEQAGHKADPAAKISGQSILKPSPQRRMAAYLSELDGDFMRVAFLAVPSASSGYEAMLFLISQDEGLNSLDALSLTSTELAGMIDELSENSIIGMVEVPPEHFRFVTAEAAARAIYLGYSMPDEYDYYLRLASGIPVAEKAAVYRMVQADPDGSSEEGPLDELTDHPLLGDVFFLEELYPYLKRLEELENSPLALTEQQKAERRQSLEAEALREAFTPGSLRTFKRFLEETALLLWLASDRRLARTALRAAVELESSPSAYQHSRLLEGLVARSFESMSQLGPDARAKLHAAFADWKPPDFPDFD